MAIMAIVPSEAAVERTFSAQGLIQTKLRNRLCANSVNNELSIKFNNKACQYVAIINAKPKSRIPHQIEAIYPLPTMLIPSDELKVNESLIVKVGDASLITLADDTLNDQAGDTNATTLTDESISVQSESQRLIVATTGSSTEPVTTSSCCRKRKPSRDKEPEKKQKKTGARRLWCVCKTAGRGSMVMCEGENCEIQWYHIKCVGLKELPPEDERWYCSDNCKKV